MARHFMSYSWSDHETALWFADQLGESGVDIWIDRRDIAPSQRWDKVVEDALHEAAGAVYILSPRSAASETCRDEINFALDAGKSVTPIMIETCRPPLRLVRVHWIDARTDRDAALKRCVAALRQEQGVDPPTVSEPPKFQLSVAQADTLVRQLTAHVGPMARHVVEHEARQAGDLPGLISRLKQRMSDPAAGAILAKIERDIALGLF